MGKWIKFAYDIVLSLLSLSWLPKICSGKYKNSWKQRLGLEVPAFERSKEGSVIWIHAVSMGETKAAAVLARELRGSARLIVSSVTETGHAEAKRLIPYAEAHFYLPLDFSWVMRKAVRYFNPSLLVLVEGEFWYNLIDEVKQNGGSVVLVNGKLSERSAKRFASVPWFAKALFSKIDLFCLQSPEYAQAFAKFVPEDKLAVTGNLKFDLKIKEFTPQDKQQFQDKLGIKEEDFVVVLGSTHEREEAMLLDSFVPYFEKIPNLVLVLVPRHPERFDVVEQLLKQRNLSYTRYSRQPREQQRVILVDTMGKLVDCFQMAQVGVLAGSFVPGIGGHNLFEPAACRLPVLFGPYTDAQKPYADALIASKGGMALPAGEIGAAVFRLYQDTAQRQAMGLAARKPVDSSLGAAKKTLECLQKSLSAKRLFVKLGASI